MNMKYLMVAAVWIGLCGVCLRGENIDPYEDGSQYAYGENVGWVNFEPGAGDGVQVGSDKVTGFVWAENVGWVKLGDGTGPYANNSATDWGVNMDASGNLSGYAWGENVGWISFSNAYSQVTIDTGTGSFDNYAWGENIGWVHFKNTTPAYGVRTTAFDTQRGTLFRFR